ncbi:Uncharacterised protein r2_g752 [Pycnogonum litorale]
MRNNPGKTITIYNLPSIIQNCWPRAATPSNITKGFECTGIVPFNPDVFGEDDYAPASVTDRPNPQPHDENIQNAINLNEGIQINSPAQDSSSLPDVEMGQVSERGRVDKETENEPRGQDVQAVVPRNQSGETDRNSTPETFSDEAISPLPKAPPRKSQSNQRKKRKTAILTDTPEKQALEEEQLRSKKNKPRPRQKSGSNPMKETRAKQPSATKKPLRVSDGETSEEECFCLVCVGPFSNSKPREKWIECISCKQWSHAQCVPLEDRRYYVCQNCSSDDSV